MKFISDTKLLSLITETYLEGLDAHRGEMVGQAVADGTLSRRRLLEGEVTGQR
jgi:hypothetical protein